MLGLRYKAGEIVYYLDDLGKRNYGTILTQDQARKLYRNQNGSPPNRDVTEEILRVYPTYQIVFCLWHASAQVSWAEEKTIYKSTKVRFPAWL